MGRNVTRLLVPLLLSLALPALGQFQKSPGAAMEEAARGTKPLYQAKTDDSTGVHVFTDTKGFRIQPYMESILHKVRESWYSAIHEMVKQPEQAQGTVRVGFTITRSGEIEDLRMVEGSGRQDLDDAVWYGVQRASPLPALPKGLASDTLKLGWEFYYKSRKKSRWWKYR